MITYVHSDVAAVADLLADQLTVLDDRDMGQETASEGRFGYASRHLLVALDRPGRPWRTSPSGPAAQVQVRTVLQHAWAEFEHDIRYKGTIPEEHVPDLDRRFTLAAGLLELADREFSAIRDRLQATADRPAAPSRTTTDPRISAPDLATFLAGQYADAGWSRTDHYAWISGLLLELGITSLDELGRPADARWTPPRSTRGWSYRYPPGAVRRLDDALLAVFGDRYVALHGNAHREALLRTRLEQSCAPPRSSRRPLDAVQSTGNRAVFCNRTNLTRAHGFRSSAARGRVARPPPCALPAHFSRERFSSMRKTAGSTAAALVAATLVAGTAVATAASEPSTASNAASGRDAFTHQASDDAGVARAALKAVAAPPGGGPLR